MLKTIIYPINKAYSNQKLNQLLRKSHHKALQLVSLLTPSESAVKLAQDAMSYWSDSQQNEFLRDQSHWLGHGRFADISTWSQIGTQSQAMVQQLCLMANRTEPITKIIEWGPGGGANAVAFAPNLETFFGVDISVPNLNECQAQLNNIGFKGFTPILIEPNNPEQVLASINTPCDLFLSTAVYQHFPSTDYGKRVTRIAAKLLSPSGLALIQIRYNSGYRFTPQKRNYQSNATFFTSYRIDEFWKIAISSGFTPLSVILNPNVNYAYYFLKKGS